MNEGLECIDCSYVLEYDQVVLYSSPDIHPLILELCDE